MNVVVLGCERLPEEADFPSLNLQKFSWLQFLDLSNKDVVERCWRADVIVTIGIPVTAQVIEEAFKLQLIIAAGQHHDHIDMEAANNRGITVANVPDEELNHENAQQICEQVVDIIDAYNQQEFINRVN